MMENEQLRILVDSTNQKITILQRNYDVILEENDLLSKEIYDIQTKSNDERVKLEADLAASIKQREILDNRINTMRNGIRELNEMLFEMIKQLNCHTEASSTSLLTTAVALPSCSLPLVPPSSTDEITHRQSKHYIPAPKSVKRIALERLETSQKLITGTTGGPPGVLVNTTNPPPPRRSQRQASTSSQLAAKTNESIQKPFTKSLKNAVMHAVDNSRQHKGFYCICGACTTSKLGLTTHINYHTYEGQFQCTVPECGKRHFSTASLRQHMKAKHGLHYKGREGCRKCGQTFLARMQLYLHCKNIHNCGPLLAHKRDEENQSQKNYSQLVPDSLLRKARNTFSQISPSEGVVSLYTKNSTDRSRNVNPPLEHHQVDTTKPSDKYFCICGREFSTGQNLRVHVKYFSFGKKFSCKVCGNRYQGTNLLRHHMRVKHNLTFVGTGCRACGDIFKTRVALYRHCRDVHNTGPFSSFGINSHHQRNAKITSKSVVIKPTTTGAITPTTVLKRQRKAPAKYREETNNLPARQPNRLISKLKKDYSEHSPLPNCSDGIKCTCGTAFTTRSALLNHINLRTRGNVFVCSFCAQKFPRRDYLSKHILSTHRSSTEIVSAFKMNTNSATSVSKTKQQSKQNQLKTKPSIPIMPSSFDSSPPPHGVATSSPSKKEFKCICGRNFVRSETLREHIRLKMGLTMFKCNLCHHTFWRHDYLKLHMQRAHKLVTSGFACRICGVTGFSTSHEVKKHRSIYHNKEDGNQDPLLSLP